MVGREEWGTPSWGIYRALSLADANGNIFMKCTHKKANIHFVYMHYVNGIQNILVMQNRKC